MTAEIIMLKDYRKAKLPAPRPVILPNMAGFDSHEAFHFTSPTRPDQPPDHFSDAELCELHDWIFGKVMGEP